MVGHQVLVLSIEVRALVGQLLARNPLKGIFAYELPDSE